MVESSKNGDGKSMGPKEEGGDDNNNNHSHPEESSPLLTKHASASHSKRSCDDIDSSAIFGKRSNSSSSSSFRAAASDSLRRVSHRILQSMSSSQREQAMTLGVGPAAFLIKDAVIGQQDAPYEGWYDPYNVIVENEFRNVIAVLCGRFVGMRWVKRMVCYFPNWILFGLSFVEPPQWCRDSDLEIAVNNMDDSLKNYGDCKVILGAWGETADGEGVDQLYPNSSSMWVSVTQSMRIELVCIGIVTFWMLLELGRDGMELRLFFYPGAKRNLHLLRCVLLICLLTGIILENTTFHPFLRMLLLTSHLRNFQRELISVLRMLPQVIYILAMLGIVVVFYAWFGVVLFYGTEQGDQTFSNLIEGIWTLWICITTANYPDVMMPSYNQNRLSAIFFVSFMIISFFYLLNLILAGVLNTFDANIEERKKKRKELSQSLLTKAFDVMDLDKTGRISKDQILAVFYILNQDFPDIRRLDNDEANLLFGFLDRDGSSTITIDEFLDFGNVLLLEFTKESEYETIVQRFLPKVYSSRWWQAVCNFVQSTTFEYGIDLILVLNAVIIAIQSYPELSGEDVSRNPHYHDGYIDTVWELMETIFTLVYVLEVIIKILVEGTKKYSESPRNMFDFCITVLAVLATAYVYYPNAYNDSRLIRFVVMARVLRLSRLLFAHKAFELIGIISCDIIPAAVYVMLMLLFLMYAFSALGVLLYGGMITRDPKNPLSQVLLQASDFVDNDYWANNFNDMFSGMNVLFDMLVVNNWNQLEVGFEYVTGGKWVRFYFFSFHVIGVIVINNVVIAFIINAFFQQLKTIEDRKGWEEYVEGEAKIKGARARFRASTITGTDTGVTGGYFARVRPRHMDVEVDERIALRNLFTQTSSNVTNGRSSIIDEDVIEESES